MNGCITLSGLRVLLVEDDVLVTMLLEDWLLEFGCAVVGPAATVDAATELVGGSAIDAALVDLQLDQGDGGYRIADALLARAIPIAFVTGYDASCLRDDYRAVPLLRKPFDSETLKAVLELLADGEPA